MALNKQPLAFAFGQGLDTKTTKSLVPAGKMTRLQNVVFNKLGELAKRNGFGTISTLPDATNTTLSTLNGNLVATGESLLAYSADTNQWLNQGTVQPVSVSTLPVVRTATSQTTADAALSAAGLACLVYTDGGLACYQITDSSTGQVVVPRIQLETDAALPRVFLLGNFFIVTYIATISGTVHLRYIAIPVNNPTSPLAAADFSTQISGLTAGYDGCVANSTLYVAWNGSDGGGAVRINSLSSTLVLSTPVVIASQVANLVSVSADINGSTPVIYISWARSSTNNAYVTAYNQNLVQILAATQFLASVQIAELTSYADAGSVSLFYQVVNSYSYVAVRSDYIASKAVTQAGVVGTQSVLCRSVGLGSKAFVYQDIVYMLVAYGGAYQPTYFLMDSAGTLIAKLAYSNGIGYATTQVLPSASMSEGTITIPYLYKASITSVNKAQGAAAVAGIYAQNGINLVTLEINQKSQFSSEIARNLHLTGGFLWQYDAIKPVEHSFHVWLEDAAATKASVGGFMIPQQYYYRFCYEWTDGQGILHRSAPSVPLSVLVGAGTNTNKVTLDVPTLRLTAKTGNNSVRIVGYRWSTAQQVYYQFTSVTSPTLNSTTVDSVQIVDTLADASILGNAILYTTGGVLENIAAPPCTASSMWDSRLWIIDAETDDVVWFSKPVLQTTPVEFSDFQTRYVAPSSSAQETVGKLRCLAPMDDKLIFFRQYGLAYLAGRGPDSTGANDQYTEPTYITSPVGCENPRSIVNMPMGLMFQSVGKGIWLLGRDLSTRYIGADVEEFNSATVLAAVAVPGTTEVRFTLDTGVQLVYDYFVQQWGTFTNVPGISSIIYENQHTYLNSLGQVRQETPGVYKDGSSPVLMSWTSAWLKLAGQQGFQRAYSAYLLSNYITPHKLNVEIAYDYDSAIRQTTLLYPTNYSAAYGDDSLYGGGSPFGGSSDVEQWRVFLAQQKCQAVQISVTEIYDGTQGVPAGAGLTFAGMNLSIGVKAGAPKLSSRQSVG